MTSDEIIAIAKENNAHASFKECSGSEQLVINSGKLELDKSTGIQGWEHAIFLSKESSLWKIGFSQSGNTRTLTNQEFKSLLIKWLLTPSNEIFKQYQSA